MSKKKRKFYAVKKGRTVGIFSTWSKCKEQVDGYKGAIYKSFSTRKQAEEYLNISIVKKEPKQKVQQQPVVQKKFLKPYFEKVEISSMDIFQTYEAIKDSCAIMIQGGCDLNIDIGYYRHYVRYNQNNYLFYKTIENVRSVNRCIYLGILEILNKQKKGTDLHIFSATSLSLDAKNNKSASFDLIEKIQGICIEKQIKIFYYPCNGKGENMREYIAMDREYTKIFN